jgi:cytochrome P450
MELKKEVKLNPDAEFHRGLTDDIITAQGIIFFVAGFETTANTLSTLCHTFAKYPEVQNRVLDEVREVMARHDGKINHETIEEMEYLEATINENLRMNSPALLHIRVCSKDTEVCISTARRKTLASLNKCISIFVSELSPIFLW